MINNFEKEYAFLSNFYNSPIEIDGIKYPTVEHAFQAMKSISSYERQRIANAPTPGLAKKLGRSILLREDWEKIKDNIMYLCLKEKFKTSELREKLLNTGTKYLEEGNYWHDNYWGNCNCPKCENIKGTNHLGKLLMKVREELQGEERVQKILIVVDMQNDFVTGSLGSKEAYDIVPNVLNKIKEYSHNGYPVIFTRDTHFSDYLKTAEGKKLPVEHCIHETEGWHIIPELRDFAHNIANKITFGSTELPEMLKKIMNGQTAEIEFVGVCTDICVVSNALITKAHFPEIKITVDASCCAGTTVENHQHALSTMESCQIDIINR